MDFSWISKKKIADSYFIYCPRVRDNSTKTPLVELESFGNNRMNLSAIYLKEYLSYGLEIHLIFLGLLPFENFGIEKCHQDISKSI